MDDPQLRGLVFLEVRVILGVTGWEGLGLRPLKRWSGCAMFSPYCSLTLYCNGRTFAVLGRSPCDKTRSYRR